MTGNEKIDGGTGASILVVDDDPHILDLLQVVLEEHRHKVFVAIDGNRALEILEKHKGIDLVITDIIMPGKEGIGLIRSIRMNDKNIKIIAITSATNYERILNTAMGFGADAALKKPFAINELISKVDLLIAG